MKRGLGVEEREGEFELGVSAIVVAIVVFKR